MPILDDDKIIEAFKKRKQQFCEWRVSSGWLENEVKDCYAIREGESSKEALWGYREELALEKRKADFKPCIAINKTAPVIDAVCGYQIQNRTEVEYSPR